MSRHTKYQTVMVLGALIVLFMDSRTCRGQDRLGVADLKVELNNPDFVSKTTRNRSRIIENLIIIVANEKVAESIRRRAVKLLGDLRARKAVSILILRVDQIRSEREKELSITSMFPCTAALINIGKPAARESIKVLRKPMKKIRRLALAVVLAGVEGRKVGRFLLQGEIAAAKSAAERKNLQLGLKAFLAMTANEREFKTDPRRGRKRKR